MHEQKWSSGRDSTMIDMETVRRLNNDDVDSLVQVLELNEDRLQAWLVLGSVTVVREDLGRSIKHVTALRELIKAEPFMDAGMNVRDAFGLARDAIEEQEE